MASTVNVKPRLRESFALDTLAIFLFALLARIAHNTPELPFSWWGVLETALPFFLGTVVATAVIGFFSYVPGSFRSGALVWFASVLLGLVYWGFSHGQIPHISFIIVASTVSAVLIFGWRGLVRLRSRG